MKTIEISLEKAKELYKKDDYTLREFLESHFDKDELSNKIKLDENKHYGMETTTSTRTWRYLIERDFAYNDDVFKTKLPNYLIQGNGHFFVNYIKGWDNFCEEAEKHNCKIFKFNSFKELALWVAEYPNFS